jgi:hypothetical protein
MSAHKFEVGQALRYTPRVSFRGGEISLECEVVRQLSTDGDNPQYRVKCTNESFDRVVVESQLSLNSSQAHRDYAQMEMRGLPPERLPMRR